MNHFYKKEKEILMGDFALVVEMSKLRSLGVVPSGDAKTLISSFSNGDAKTPISRFYSG